MQGLTEKIYEAYGDKLLVLTDMDSAIIGLDILKMRVIYSIPLIIEYLMEDMDDETDAWEWFYYNIDGAYMGPHTPIYLTEEEVEQFND